MATRNRIRLTDTGIARLRPQAREFTVWDSRVPGLGVRMRPNGGKSYVLIRTVDGRTRRVSLGPTASKGVDLVRMECLTMQAEAQGAVRRRRRGRRRCSATSSPVRGTRRISRAASLDSQANSIRLSTQLLPTFGATKLDRISATQVERWFEGYSKTAPSGANRATDILRQILNFGIACGHLETNPTRGVRRNRRTPMTRFLSRDEIRRLHEALDAASQQSPSQRQQADVIRLLMFTGCRKGEVVNLRWSEVDSDFLALADSKTGPRKVYLNPQSRAVLNRQPHGPGPYVFPSHDDPGRPRSDTLRLWLRVRRAAGIEEVRLHDLRHTYASHAVMNGVPVPVVSRLLGHSSVQMTLRYVHLGDRDVRAAAERVGDAMARLMATGRIQD